MKENKRILIILGVLIVMLLGSLLIWSLTSKRDAEPAVEPYLQISDSVIVTSDQWLTFTPADQVPAVGFIFYPGANVDASAYAPALHRIAEEGYLVVDVPMPLNLALFGSGKADKVIAAYPEIASWVIGGHSLGGAMATRYADKNPGKVDGLALWASYPAEANSLADAQIQVISIYGTLDGLATVEEIQAAESLLPADTGYYPLEGGNHAQFGFYGPQQGDLPATITRKVQQDLIVELMNDFLMGFE